MASLVWLSFIAFILLMLALDLGVFHKKEHVVSTREALRWTALWVSLALTFNIAIYFLYEHHLEGSPCRFDVVSVMLAGGEERIRHFKNAFMAV